MNDIKAESNIGPQHIVQDVSMDELRNHFIPDELQNAVTSEIIALSKHGNGMPSLETTTGPLRMKVFRDVEGELDLRGLDPTDIMRYGLKRQMVLSDIATHEFVTNVYNNPGRVSGLTGSYMPAPFNRDDVVSLKSDEADTNPFKDQYRGPSVSDLCPQVDREEVIAKLSRLRELSAEGVTAETLKEKSDIHTYFGEYSEEIVCLQQLCTQEPSAESYVSLALAHLRIRQAEEAKEALESALQVDQDYPEALESLGYLYMKEGRGHEAISLLERDVSQRPDARETVPMLVRLYQHTDALDKAEAITVTYLEHHPEDASMWGMHASTARLRGDTESEIELLKKALSLDPDNMIHMMNLLPAMERYRQENPPHVRLGRLIKRFFGW